MDEQDHEITRLLPAWGRGGDDERRLLELLEPYLFKFARLALKGKASLARKVEPGDLVSEVYLRLHRAYGTRDDVSFENRKPFLAIVLTATRHALLDLARRGGTCKPETSDLVRLGDSFEVADQQSSVEDIHVFYDALDRLRAKDESQAMAIELKYIAGLTWDECAKVSGLTTAVLRRKLDAAVVWFRAQVRPTRTDSERTTGLRPK